MKKVLILLFLLGLSLLLISCGKDSKYEFKYWNDAKAITELTNYVEDVTNEKSANYIPVEDRIATFDMDGTLCGELFPTYLEYLICAYRVLDDPTCNPTDEMIDVANQIRAGWLEDGTGKYDSNMAIMHANTQAKAFAGMTLLQFENWVKNFMQTEAFGFKNMKYADCFYLPMLEVIDYLNQNEFLTYIVSGSDRFICRTVASSICNIPYERIIGMDVNLVATDEDEVEGVNYQFKATDSVLRGDKLLVKNLKFNKVAQITQEIGRQPVLSFGNSSGDVSMHLYTITNNKYKSLAFMLIADDEARDYGNETKNTELGKTWEEYGFIVISMKNDFKTIYGYDVVKTANNKKEVK